MGGTTIAVTLASVLKEKNGLKTAVLEISSGAFDAPLYCGIKIKQEEAVMPVKFSDGTGDCGPVIIGDTGENLKDILTMAEGEFDLLLIDTNTIDEAYLTAADVIIVPTAADYASTRHALAAAERIKSLRYPPAMIKFLINKNDTAGLEPADLAKVLPGFITAGILPASAAASKAAAEGKSASVKQLKDKFVQSLESVFEKIIPAIKPKDLRQRMVEYDSVKKAASSDEAAVHETARKDRASEQKKAVIKKQVYKTLFDELDMTKMEAEALEGTAKKEKIHREIREKILEIFDTVSEEIKSRDERDEIANELFLEVTGYGPLEQFLADPAVTEIMVNRYDVIYVERKGKITLSGAGFTDDEAVRRVMERIVMPLGRRIDDSKPYVDARLPDGSRVNAVIHPLALDGSVLTIRKFSDRKLVVEDLINYGSITRDCADYIQNAVSSKKNIIVSGGTGSGKTTLLNILSSFIPSDERIITIEDSAELKLEQPHVVRLETRAANLEGRGAVTIRDLVINALRMRPDRIIVGECRGGEALDMLQAMNTGHEGSMTTLHANTPRDALSRLEVMILMAGVDLPVRAIREQIRGAVNIIVQQSRLPDGSRKITKVSEIHGMDGDILLLEDVFSYEVTGPAGSLVRKKVK